MIVCEGILFDATTSHRAMNSTEIKIKRKRFNYDPKQLDHAVDLIIKNKLSMRAAAHIYKIPFSSLRTRKIFKTKNAETIEDLEEDHAENDECQTSETDLINDKQQAAKLPSNQTFIRNLKNKCHKLNFGRKFKIGKPKRLYIKRDKLEKFLKTDGFNKITNLLDDKYSNLNDIIIKKQLNMKTIKSKDVPPERSQSKSFTSKEESIRLSAHLSVSNSKFSRTISLESLNSSKSDTSDVLNSLDNHLVELKTNASNINENITDHNMKKSVFKCNSSQLLFTDLHNLNEHQDCSQSVNTINGNTGSIELNFKCYFCKQTFCNKLKLMSHALLCSSVNCF